MYFMPCARGRLCVATKIGCMGGKVDTLSEGRGWKRGNRLVIEIG